MEKERIEKERIERQKQEERRLEEDRIRKQKEEQKRLEEFVGHLDRRLLDRREQPRIAAQRLEHLWKNCGRGGHTPRLEPKVGEFELNGAELPDRRRLSTCHDCLDRRKRLVTFEGCHLPPLRIPYLDGLGPVSGSKWMRL